MSPNDVLFNIIIIALCDAQYEDDRERFEAIIQWLDQGRDFGFFSVQSVDELLAQYQDYLDKDKDEHN